jgi:hypothetical protein
MKKTSLCRQIIALGAMSAAALASLTVQAQEVNRPVGDSTPANPVPETWTYRPSPERTPNFTLAQQKAQLRGAQRMARLEALRWYGFSNSRPTASALPWTTMYSPAWQQPGGRPFAWYTSTRPVVIIAQPGPLYR